MEQAPNNAKSQQYVEKGPAEREISNMLYVAKGNIFKQLYGNNSAPEPQQQINSSD